MKNEENKTLEKDANIKEETKIDNKDKKVKKNDKKKEHDEEITKLKEQLAIEKENTLRMQAEMINFKHRKEDEVANMYKYANEDILKKLVNIVDNFERAFSLETKENQEFLKGFNMIYTNILNILKENEVKEIECLNEAFDPKYEQAILTETKEGVDAGIVIEVMQKGYMYKERVLRAAMVKVSE